jgi:hypothetical protein
MSCTTATPLPDALLRVWLEKRSMFLGLCQASGQQPDVGDEEPSDFGCSGAFEVLGEAAASTEPGEGAFDDPPSRQQLEALDALRSLHDLDRPRSAMGDCGCELVAAVDPVGEDMAQLWEPASQPLQQRDGSMAILTLAGWTWTASRRPLVSVTMCRLRP